MKCRICGSKKTVKNGKNKEGSAQYHCKSCNFYGTVEPKRTRKKK